ncbi:hypothetical protein SOVF_036110 [Spinacia oleracea]|uniref:MADS-box domain-containing protein n=1 Tax=Spinacia oleracea TaxID=3562 RepID=A0A9R0I7F6_SPIOL|nr:uncharacterized protein LOC110784122 [Spinacia oleracea]KNA22212.1 hypothetical protein SOVF_036110 [Spinacia oleracea]
MELAKTPHVKKAKKKQVKDELDRMKQAEKKRRRLEKALATSAAIRSELEKKKQLKKEEQQRLDEEGAAIAEAVALHVLLGEDSDDTTPTTIVLKKEEEEDDFGGWHHHHAAANIGLFMEKSGFSHHQKSLKKYSVVESVGWFPGSYGQQECDCNHFGDININRSYSSSFPLENNFQMSYLDDGLLAAQAVSSLQIGEDARVDRLFFNRY